MAKKLKINAKNGSLNTNEAVRVFRKAADAYSAKATRTKASANSALVNVGTHTPKGNLSKNYK